MLPFPIISNTNIIPNTTIKKIVSSAGSILYLTSTGNLYAAGTNTGGELGTGSKNPVPQFTLLKTNVHDVWASDGTLAVIYVDNSSQFFFSGDKRVYTAGSSPDQISTFINITSMFSNAGITKEQIKDIYFQYTLKIQVVLTNGSLFCAGKNNVATLSSFGDGTNDDSVSTFRYIRTDVKMAQGNFILDTNDILYGTGINLQYQLGTGNTTSTTTFIQIKTNVSIFRQGYQSVFVISDGLLYITGTSLGTFGEFGDSSTVSKQYTTLTQITQAGTGIINFNTSIGNVNSHLINSTGYLNTGNNSLGQLGRGNTTTIYTWGVVPIVAVLSSTIIVNSNNTYLYTPDSRLYGCGNKSGGFNTIKSSNVLLFEEITLTIN